jgi:hypothetical protein
MYGKRKQKVSFDNTIGPTDLLPFKENKFEVLVCVFYKLKPAHMS